MTLSAVSGQAATPTFSPAAGTYSSAQTVTISDTTSGATIYYTTNGTTPTTSSSVYTGPIAVPSTETLEAIATATGYSQSAVGTAAYTISSAQITGGGTANTVPAFTGTSTIGNSVITQSSGNVGIGMPNPGVPLDVNGYSHVTGNINPTTVEQGAYLNWNALTGGWGETDFINNPGGGYGGFAFMTVPASGSPRSTLMFINGANGNVGIGTTTPAATFQVSSPTSTPASMVLGNGNTGTGGNTFLSFYLSAISGGYATIQAAQSAGSSWGNLVLNPNAGNVGIGTTSPAYNLDVAGAIHTSTALYLPDGTKQTTAWTGVLCGGDYAEAVNPSGGKKSYEPGDVLVLTSGADNEVQKSAEPYSTMVAGIYATKPGVIGRRESLVREADELPMAMVGIVPTKVSSENGPIRKGDLLVTSSAPGYAMKGTDRGRMLGAVIGKAMGSLDSGEGVIEVLVTLQ